jgi:hypothetical protein
VSMAEFALALVLTMAAAGAGGWALGALYDWWRGRG